MSSIPTQNASFEAHIFENWRLLRSFISRDLRSRYAGSSLGVFWSIVHPLVMLVLYIVVFSTLVRGGRFNVRGQIADYALFLCPALLAWNWVLESCMGSASSITSNGTLIKKVVFPASILPLAPVLAGLLPFCAAMGIFMIFVMLKGAFHPATLIYLPFVTFLQLIFLIGPAYLFSALNVFVRDTVQVLQAALQILFWATPIVYTQESLLQPYPFLKIWFDLNPIAHLVNAYRLAIIASSPPPLQSVVYLLVFSLVSYHAGRTVFVRSRAHFPDEV